MNEIVSEDLTIRKSISGDDYSQLDFTEEDGTDPLKVNDFFHTGKAETFQQNKLASIWCVEHKGKLVYGAKTDLMPINLVKSPVNE